MCATRNQEPNLQVDGEGSGDDRGGKKIRAGQNNKVNLRIVADYIATLIDAGQQDEADEAVKEAVEQKLLILPGYQDGPIPCRIDLRDMNFGLARAVVRYTLQRRLDVPPEKLREISFITGYGNYGHATAATEGGDGEVDGANGATAATAVDNNNNNTDGGRVAATLRELVQTILKTDYVPSIESHAPPEDRTIDIDMDSLRRWVVANSNPATADIKDLDAAE